MEPWDAARSFEEHYAGLVRRLTLVLQDEDEARDVAQETFLRAYRSSDRFDGRDARAWLHTIGLRLAFNHLRRRRVVSWVSLRRSTPAYMSEQDADLSTALRRLAPRLRAALLLNVVDGYSQEEIASMLGTHRGTVAGWVAAAKKQMRADLEGRPNG